MGVLATGVAVGYGTASDLDEARGTEGGTASSSQAALDEPGPGEHRQPGASTENPPHPDPSPKGEGSLSADRRLTLNAALQLALANSPELRAGVAGVAGAAARAYQAKLWSNPDLEMTVEEWPVSGSGGFSDSQRTIGVAQAVPFPGKKRLDGQIGRSGVRLSEAELALRRVEVTREVKVAFYQVLAAERLVEVQQELVQVAESSANTARKRVQAGAAADQEQLRAELPFEQAKSELDGLRHELEAARHGLALAIGRPELSRAQASGALAEAANLGLLAQGVEACLEKHPAVSSARAKRQRAELEVRRARLEPYPDVTAALSGGTLGDTGQSIVELGFSVPLPVLDWGKGKKLEARANLDQSDAELAGIEQRLRRDWAVAGERLKTAAAQTAAYRERILPKANEALRLVQRGFEEGKFGFIDLLDTQRTAAEARLNYHRKLLELNIAQAEVEALLGQVPSESRPAKDNPTEKK